MVQNTHQNNFKKVNNTQRNDQRQNVNFHRAQQHEYNSNRDVSGKNPSYLRNVESKIKDQVRMTRTQMMYQNQNANNYDVPVEIFEGPKPKQRYKKDTQQI